MLETIAERVAFARKLAGLSQRSLSSLALKSATHVTLIESGARTRLSANTVMALANALGVSFEWLQTGRGRVPTKRTVATAIRAAQQRLAANDNASGVEQAS